MTKGTTKTLSRFAPEREVKVESLGQAVEVLTKDFAYNTRLETINTLAVTDEYKLTVGKDNMKMTPWAFQNLLGLLKIPTTFGANIPPDLLETIVNRLKGADPFGVKIFVEKDGNVANVKKATYHAPKLSTILQAMKGDIAMARIGIRGVKVATEVPAIQSEPEVGDVIKVGTMLVASETGGPLPKVNLMTFRLVCSNGAVVGDSFGNVHWGNSKDDGGLDNFLNGLATLNGRASQIAEALQVLPTRKVTDVEFGRMWNQVRTMFDTETTDAVFKVEPEVRKLYLAQSILKKKQLLQPGPVDLSAWDVFNSISYVAKDMPFVQNEALMRVAGSLLN
jgi:hypothetical protein